MSEINQKAIYACLEQLKGKEAREGFIRLREIAIMKPATHYSTQAMYFLGVFYAHRNEMERALVCFDRVILHHAKFPIVHLAKAWAEKLKTQSCSAVSEFSQALALGADALLEFAIRHRESALADNALLEVFHLTEEPAARESMAQRILAEYPDSDSASYIRYWKEKN